MSDDACIIPILKKEIAKNKKLLETCPARQKHIISTEIAEAESALAIGNKFTMFNILKRLQMNDKWGLV